MKLGQALSRRAKISARLNDIRGRIVQNALLQEGQKPVESPGDLLKQFEELSGEFQELVEKINVANTTAKVGDQSILELLQRREHLIRVRNMIGTAASAASPGGDRYRYMRSEIAMVPALDVQSLRQREDSLTEEINAIDAQIQEINWQVEV